MSNQPQPRKVCRKCWTTHGRARGNQTPCLAEQKPRHTPVQMAYMLHQAAIIRERDETRYAGREAGK